jgi:hypothetical protein
MTGVECARAGRVPSGRANWNRGTDIRPAHRRPPRRPLWLAGCSARQPGHSMILQPPHTGQMCQMRPTHATSQPFNWVCGSSRFGLQVSHRAHPVRQEARGASCASVHRVQPMLSCQLRQQLAHVIRPSLKPFVQPIKHSLGPHADRPILRRACHQAMPLRLRPGNVHLTKQALLGLLQHALNLMRTQFFKLRNRLGVPVATRVGKELVKPAVVHFPAQNIDQVVQLIAPGEGLKP